MSKKIAFAADHAGFTMKQHLIAVANSHGYECTDFGTNNEDAVDYPLVVPPVIEAIKKHQANFGVLICGSGIGIDIAANRHAGIRSALCYNGEMAEMARKHNDANVLSLGSRFIDMYVAEECLLRFLKAEFEGGRHQRRVEQLG